tara:strand:- start:262 stop:1620 length:1359 start_codon:yes stop_codon:yes gene_type:complete
MEYKLKDIHYKRALYFDKEQHGKNYNVFDDYIIPNIFNHQLIFDTLNYILFDNDITYLKKHKIDDIIEIFEHFIIEEYDYLKLLNSDKFNIESVKELNETFLLNPKLSNIMFKLMNLSENTINILNDHNNIKDHIFTNLRELNEYKHKKIFSCYIKFNENIPTNMLSKTLKKIIFCDGYNQPINKNVLPESIQTIIFGEKFNQILIIDSLPKSLETLIFGTYYNQPINKYVLPESIETIYLDIEFNQTLIEGVFGNNLKHLVLRGYNQQLNKDVLPESLETLNLGIYFNHPLIKGVFGNNLTHLYISYNFNHPINIGVLPRSLIHLSFNDTMNDQVLLQGVVRIKPRETHFGDVSKFNHPIGKKVLPEFLEYIRFGSDFNQEINEDVLPQSLKTVIFGKSFKKKINKNVIPKSVIYLRYINYVRIFRNSKLVLSTKQNFNKYGMVLNFGSNV